jgi:hypothetical protein
LKNIVIKKGKSLEFKIADLGLCHFEEGKVDSIIQTDHDYGTKTFGLSTSFYLRCLLTISEGAPEAYYPRGAMDDIRLKITEKIDIWAISCIISITAGWMLLGWGEVGHFSDMRKREAQILMKGSPDCFHQGDGKSVLDCVKSRLREYKERCRYHNDEVTLQIIEVADEVFQRRPDERHSAQELITRFNSILDAGKSRLKAVEDEESRECQSRLEGASGPSKNSVKLSNKKLKQPLSLVHPGISTDQIESSQPYQQSGPSSMPQMKDNDSKCSSEINDAATSPKSYEDKLPAFTTKEAKQWRDNWKSKLGTRVLTKFKRSFTSSQANLEQLPAEIRGVLSRINNRNHVSQPRYAHFIP